MKSVLFINYEYPPTGAGAANAAWHFANGIAARNIRTSVLTSAYRSHRGSVTEGLVTVHRIAALRRHAEKSSFLQMACFTFSALLRLAPVIRRESPDVIVVFFSIPCGPAALYARMKWGIPYAVMLRGGDVPGSDPRLSRIHRMLTPIRRLVYRKSIAIIANSESLGRMAESADRTFTVAVVANGVDTSFFSPAIANGSASSRPFTFLFVGRICPQKNLSLLLEAFADCLSDFPALRLVLVGDGPDRPRLDALAHRLDITHALTWTGWETRKGLLMRYRKTDCFVNPSINEGMPNAVLEAMSCALPVVASDCTGNRDLVADGVSGLLFRSGSSDDIKCKLRMLINNTSAARAMGSAAREICCKRYSWSASTDRLLRIISEGYAP